MAQTLATLLAAAIIATAPWSAARAQKSAATPPLSALTYADMADLALGAPIVAEVRIRKAEALKGALAPGLAMGQRRYLIEADVMTLIRGTGGLPPRINYIVDVGPDARGRWPRLGKQAVMIFALPVQGRPAEVRLVAPDAQHPLLPPLGDRVRAILAEAISPSAPPPISGVGQAFHVRGSLPGEGETQIFLQARDGRPASLSIWRTQGAPPRWAVSLGEIVDEGGGPPRRDTLAWYRLACTLPRQLPPGSTASVDPEEARIAAEDYQTVITTLGPCQRSRGTGSPARSS